jgi:hypothetical protein
MGSLLKKIPGVGTIVNAGAAAYHGFQAATADSPEERNKALANMAMSAASMIPGVGTAISVAQDMGVGDMIGGGVTSLFGGGGEGGGGGAGGGGGGGGASQESESEGGGGGGFFSSLFG